MKSIYLMAAVATVFVAHSSVVAAQTCPDRFVAADPNRDGYLDADEYGAIQAELFTGLDADQNGFVSLDEYTRCFTEMQVPAEDVTTTPYFAADWAPKNHPISRQGYFAAARSWYGGLPRDGSGRVTVEAYANALGAGAEATDRDADGFVRPDEVAAEVARAHALYELQRSNADLNAMAAERFAAYEAADERGFTMEEFQAIDRGVEAGPRAHISPWQLQDRGY